MNYILRKQIGKDRTAYFFNGDIRTATDFTKYVTTDINEATILTESEIKAYRWHINQGSFKEVKVD